MALRESEASIAVGADFLPQLFGVFKMQLNKVAKKAGGGLKKAIDFYEEVKAKHPKITYADLYQVKTENRRMGLMDF
ncbi:L-ascorbate peroxidase 5, peroxisomal-like [Cajanus cajan]|uniref:L-ascorbate peroxidase 5, peroxisomal-like n=1 Tax=Cajanus cajan TaxID=3821 RepID=UPI0010FBA203|nr:L-ascorbate peroxidase 5, peroxisomal-like [Cajanus cajan]XP_029131035.1 L-ascorbate peroxidase 5, peroxisomal-like isoform X2 [Cajanus cajan]XP_029131036.1 L-ascorbate peroxidase 5, peroxisomal-like [Cajanus cajan]